MADELLLYFRDRQDVEGFPNGFGEELLDVLFSSVVLVDGNGVHVLVLLRHLVDSSICLPDLELWKLLIFWLDENTEIKQLTLGLVFPQPFGGVILCELVELLADIKVVDQ